VLVGPISPSLKVLAGLVDQSYRFLLSPTPVIAGLCQVGPSGLQAGYASVHHARLVDIAWIPSPEGLTPDLHQAL